MDNPSTEAAYLTMPTNIVHQLHTIADALTPTAKAAHITKADLEVAAQVVRGRASVDQYPGRVSGMTTGGSINKGL